MKKMQLTLTVNGEAHDVLAEPRELLIHVLRERLGLTGPHIGCETSHCGACTIDMNGRSVKSCTVFAAQADGATITTIEGLGAPGALHPLQEAFREHHGLQCGFCTPGMIMMGVDIVNRHPEGLDEETIRKELEGNIRRCTGYHNIVKAIGAAAEEMSSGTTQMAAE